MRIKVCDAMMGTGKTTAAINYMNANAEERYLYITPFLNEDSRIANACPTLNFAVPEVNYKEKLNKLDDLHRLLKEKRNIVSTHALFQRYNSETMDLIKEGGYILILDESMDVVTVADAIHPLERKSLFRDGILEVDEKGYVTVHDELIDQTHSSWDRVQTFKDKTVTYSDKYFFIYELPINRFDSFKEVFVLTYMFDCQVQKYYYDIFGYEYEYLYVSDEDVPVFTTDSSKAKIVKPNKSLFNVVEDESLNEVGEPMGAWSKPLSRSNYTNNGEIASSLRKNLSKLFFTRWGAPKDLFLWTTYKKFENEIGFKDIKDSFLACNSKSTNAYADKKYLAYCIDRYPNPMLIKYFSKHGVKVNQDGMALSQMLQWIYRSAIRKGEKIFLYLPSKRMRNLLYKWLGGKPEATLEGIDEYVGIYMPVKGEKAKSLKAYISKLAGENLNLYEACDWIKGRFPYIYVKDRIRIDHVKYVCVKLMAL